MQQLLTKKNINACLTFDQKPLNDPWDFWENILWTDDTNMVVQGYFGTSRSEEKNGNLLSEKKNTKNKGECLAIISCPKARAHYVAGQWSNTYLQVHLSMAQIF